MITSAPFLWIPIGSRTHCAGFKKWWPPTFWSSYWLGGSSQIYAQLFANWWLSLGLGTRVPLKNPNPLRSQESKPRPQTTHQNRNSWYEALSPMSFLIFILCDWRKEPFFEKNKSPWFEQLFFPLANSWNIWNQTACNLVQFGACLSCKELPSLQMNYLYYGQMAKVNEIFFFFCLLLIVFNEKCPNFPEEQRYKLWSVHYGGCHAGQRLPMPNHDFTNLESCTRLNQVLAGSDAVEKLSRIWLLLQKSYQNWWKIMKHGNCFICFEIQDISDLFVDENSINYLKASGNQLSSSTIFWRISCPNLMTLCYDRACNARCCLFLKPRNAAGRVQFTRNQAGCSLQSNKSNVLYNIIW